MSSFTPQTPPRTRRAAPTQGNATPVTPYKNKGSLMTPAASSKKLADPFKTGGAGFGTQEDPENVFKTPSSILKKPTLNYGKQTGTTLFGGSTSGSGQSLFGSKTAEPTVHTNLLTPEFTPQRSPHRSARKRKIFPEDIFQHATNTISKVNDRLSFGLLLPTPSTVGSGRKAPSTSKGTRLLSPHNNIKTSAPDHLADQLDIEKEEEIELDLEVPALKEPITPATQLIDDELVSHWHGKSFNNYSSDEEDLSDIDVIKMKPKLVNPFVVNRSEQSPCSSPEGYRSTRKDTNPFSDPYSSPLADKSNIDYSTHMEYINNRSGVKRVVKLTSRQQKIKPKKLDFSGI